MRQDRLRLLDALEQIALIRQFAAQGKAAFLGDLLVQSAILHRLVLLGEACRGLSVEAAINVSRGSVATDCRVSEYSRS